MTEVRRPSPATSPASRGDKPKLDHTKGQVSVVLPAPRSFKPHRGLFWLIGAMLFAWLAVLLVLYITTVYPYRHSRVEYPGENLPISP